MNWTIAQLERTVADGCEDMTEVEAAISAGNGYTAS